MFIIQHSVHSVTHSERYLEQCLVFKSDNKNPQPHLFSGKLDLQDWMGRA